MTKEEKVNLIIDGRHVQAQLHEPLLKIAERIGVRIPSLCHHEALEPLGACRLCLVEVSKRGRKKIVTSCNYPAEEGIEVKTSTASVIKHRRMVIEVLLGMCPDVPVIKELASSMGVETSRFEPRNETCILCGLCTRVCEEYSTSAIAFLNRGEKRKVGADLDDSASSCIGCGACALLCPTGHIETQKEPGRLSILSKNFQIGTFSLAVCAVNDGKCIGCGMCEEACPFSIPRVVFKKDNSPKAAIDVGACLGCGVCLAACPCGAIEQPRAKREIPPLNRVSGKPNILAISCPRSGLQGLTESLSSLHATLLELPCAGGVSPAMLLGALARGYDGVLVLGRQEETCRLAGAEAHGRSVVQRVNKVADVLNLGKDRVVFAEPAKGANGPLHEIERFSNTLTNLNLRRTLSNDVPLISHGDAATTINWLIENTVKSKNLDYLDVQADVENILSIKPTYITKQTEKYASFIFRDRRSEAALSLGTRPAEGLRIDSHPILEVIPRRTIKFTFNRKTMPAKEGEMIASAMFANGISTFGHHPRDRGGQGIFCANGQCSQCTVLADGRAVKSCMVQVTPGMEVTSVDGLPPLMAEDEPLQLETPSETKVKVLILGGGPAGLCAAIELGRAGIDVLVVDDKPELGGKLTLQTHGFFGSAKDCFAGTRGIDIGKALADEVAALPSVKVWTSATALGLFFDGKVGISTRTGYRLVAPDNLLIAMGAREKALAFPGCDLPGVFGAGAFQTLVNRDLVAASKKLFVLGGGNVGLIGAYHALQAGIDVVGLVEALPECGGYKVHADKIKRLGVPIWTSHTVVRANGDQRLETVTIAKVDKNFAPIHGTEKTFEVDTLLIAVGLAPVDELLTKAREYGIKVYAAGDSDEVAEASAAIFSGRIAGRKMARDLGINVDIPAYFEELVKVLKSRPGKTFPWKPKSANRKVYPLIRCAQEIPCDPCVAACPENSISMKDIMSLPKFDGNCLGCARCVVKCPGLAITLVCEDYDNDKKTALLVLPFELGNKSISVGKTVRTVDFNGNSVGNGRVIGIRERQDQDRRKLVLVEVPWDERLKVAGFAVRGPSMPIETAHTDEDEDPIICRCERVRKSEIVSEIRAGVRDINQLKALARPSMGGCGGKTCTALVMRIIKEEGIPLDEVTSGTIRPLIAEAPLGLFVKRGN